MNRLSDSIYHNTTINKLKAIAKNSEYSECRFVIDFNGKLTCGDGFTFIHENMVNESDTYESGYVTYYDGVFEYYTYNDKKHPIIDQFIEYGIKHR